VNVEETHITTATPTEPSQHNGARIDCPQCGTTSVVEFARRDAEGFCRVCDFPLFWARDRVEPPAGDAPADSGLRRLPGTVGHASLAALACPVCNEPNQPSARICVRCGSDMHPVVVAPPPPPPAPEPEPEPEPIPEPTRWRWWPIVVAAAVAIAVLVVLLIVFN
jgi:hypothetical protein